MGAADCGTHFIIYIFNIPLKSFSTPRGHFTAHIPQLRHTLSISCGGHPCRVEIAAELQINGEILSISSLVTFRNCSAWASSTSLHSLNIFVCAAFFIFSINVSIFSNLIPARSYPTLMLNWNPWKRCKRSAVQCTYIR